MRTIGLLSLIAGCVYLVKKAKDSETVAGSGFSSSKVEESGGERVRIVGAGGAGRADSRPVSGDNERIQVTHEQTIAVERNSQPLWKSKGWRKVGGKYVGSYKVNGKKYRGEAHKKLRYYKFFVHNPPRSVKNGSHGACFRKRNGKYWIHFNKKPKELSSGIVAVEETMKNSMN